jgi:hypothetical protein
VLGSDPLLDDTGEVLTAEMGVAGRGADLHHALVLVENRDVEGPTPEIKDQELTRFRVPEAIGEGRCRGLIDQSLDLEAS